jgi:indolepyruvate ferredoxin oxidoreductase alpha subunit
MILLDNHGAASTGFQPTPAVGADALGQPAPKLSISEIARACGVPRVRCIPSGASNNEIKKALLDGLVNKGLELLIIEVERG